MDGSERLGEISGTMETLKAGKAGKTGNPVLRSDFKTWASVVKTVDVGRVSPISLSSRDTRLSVGAVQRRLKARLSIHLQHRSIH